MSDHHSSVSPVLETLQWLTFYSKQRLLIDHLLMDSVNLAQCEHNSLKDGETDVLLMVDGSVGP